MPALKWTARALADVQRLYRFLAPKDPAAARRAARAIRTGARILAAQPEIGRPADVLGRHFREWIIEFGRDGYVVLYHYDQKAVVVLAVRHGRECGYAR